MRPPPYLVHRLGRCEVGNDHTPVFVEHLRNVCRRGTRTDCLYCCWHGIRTDGLYCCLHGAHYTGLRNRYEGDPLKTPGSHDRAVEVRRQLLPSRFGEVEPGTGCENCGHAARENRITQQNSSATPVGTTPRPTNMLHATSYGPDWPFTPTRREKKLAASAVRDVTRRRSPRREFHTMCE